MIDIIACARVRACVRACIDLCLPVMVFWARVAGVACAMLSKSQPMTTRAAEFKGASSMATGRKSEKARLPLVEMETEGASWGTSGLAMSNER